MVGRWAPVVLWMAIVFFFSSLSHLGKAARVPDWISHPIEYGVGAAMVCRALDDNRRRALTVSTALTATLLTTAYGVTDEYHQSFVPGRTSDPMDVAKDLAGSAAASFLYRRWSMEPTAARWRPSPP
ncbi:MAG TPA: VanZ family protein [Vicinamibacteria bacterium]